MNLAALVVVALAASWARADGAPLPAPAPTERTITDVQAAELLLGSGKAPEARTLLLLVERTRPLDSEVQFLLGLIAVQEKDYAQAIHRFRGILVREPKSERVRLELARAFFLAKDYDNAERQFRFARAGNPPPAVVANIDRYLGAIRQLRRWTGSFAVGAAPDTNENAGPSSSTVDIFGLPFQLSNDAQRRSGVGVTVDAAGEWTPPITNVVRLRLGGQFHRVTYGDGAFDDMTVSAYAGPRFVKGRWDVSPLVTGFERWYGNRFYNRGVGGALQAIYYPSQRLGLTGTLGGQQVTYGPPEGQSGPALSGSLSFFYTLNSASVLSGSISANRQYAQLPAYANTAIQYGMGVYRDLPAGFTLSLEPSYTTIKYDAALAAFGVARSDRQWTVQVTALNRRIDFHGFTPLLRYAYTRNASNISLYAYDRSRFDIGVTRTF